MSRNSARLLILAAAAGLAAPCLAQPYSFHTLALSGDPAPGLPAGVTFSYFSDPRLSLGGSIAFWAELAGPGVTTANDGSVWSNRSGSLALVAREGDPISGTLVIGALPDPAFSPDGRIALQISLLDTAAPTNPITLANTAEDSTQIRQILAQEGQPGPPPIPPASTWSNLAPPALVGPAAAFNSNNGIAAWSATPGQTPAPAAASGSPAPGTTGNFAFIDQPFENSAGTLVFRATTTDAAHAMGLWATRSGALAPVAVAGMQAPGAPAGATFAEFALQPTITAADTAVFWARLSGVVSSAEDTGVWLATAQSLGVVAREGDAAPTLPGLFLGPIGQHPAAGGGTVAFTSSLLGPGIDATNNSAVWMSRAGSGGALAPLAREGDHAARLPQDVFYAGFSEPLVNESGQLMFLARLRGPGVTTATNAALYSTDVQGRLVPLIRTGDFFDVGSGPARMVDEIIIDSDPATGRAQFIAGGVSIFKLVFRDTTAPPSMALSSGLFTASFRCAADMDDTGALNVNDFNAFLVAFASSNLRSADFTGDGRLNVNDFIFYQTAFAVGCQ